MRALWNWLQVPHAQLGLPLERRGEKKQMRYAFEEEELEEDDEW
jgi:hypothetical protein